MTRTVLLVCGILAPVLYLITDVTGVLQWDAYSYPDQTVSELSALDAPSRPIVSVMFTAYNALLMAFAGGVAARAINSRLRRSAYALGSIGVFGLAAALFPIQQRGGAFGPNESMHILLTLATVICIVSAIGFASRVAGRRFYAYSLATIAATLFFGSATGAYAGRIAGGEPTPWVGVLERICIFSYQAWVAVFAVLLLRGVVPQPRLEVRGDHAS